MLKQVNQTTLSGFLEASGNPLLEQGGQRGVPHHNPACERMMVIETTSPVWQTGALTFVLHPHNNIEQRTRIELAPEHWQCPMQP